MFWMLKGVSSEKMVFYSWSGWEPGVVLDEEKRRWDWKIIKHFLKR
jgi:hypothetical protein